VKHPGVKLRSIFTGGESLGGELLGWVRETFGIDAHEVFGQTECNLVIGSNSNLFPIRPVRWARRRRASTSASSTTRARSCREGSAASSACASHARAPMLEYWRNPEATAKKYAGDFLLTGDLGTRMRTAISGTSAARTTSSPPPAIASARPRSSTR
jgi:acetyl-CoA synthetase